MKGVEDNFSDEIRSLLDGNSLTTIEIRWILAVIEPLLARAEIKNSWAQRTRNAVAAFETRLNEHLDSEYQKIVDENISTDTIEAELDEMISWHPSNRTVAMAWARLNSAEIFTTDGEINARRDDLLAAFGIEMKARLENPATTEAQKQWVLAAVSMMKQRSNKVGVTRAVMNSDHLMRLIESFGVTPAIASTNRAGRGRTERHYLTLRQQIARKSEELGPTYQLKYNRTLGDDLGAGNERATLQAVGDQIAFQKDVIGRTNLDREALNERLAIAISTEPSIADIKAAWTYLISPVALNMRYHRDYIEFTSYTVETLPDIHVRDRFTSFMTGRIHNSFVQTRKAWLLATINVLREREANPAHPIREEIDTAPTEENPEALAGQILPKLRRLEALGSEPVDMGDVWTHLLDSLGFAADEPRPEIRGAADFSGWIQEFIEQNNTVPVLTKVSNAVQILLGKRDELIQQTKAFCGRIFTEAELQAEIPTIGSVAEKIRENAPSATDIKIVWKALARQLHMDPTQIGLIRIQRPVFNIDTLEDAEVSTLFNTWLAQSRVRLERIDHLAIEDPDLEVIPIIGNFPNLTWISFRNCPKLKSIPNQLFASRTLADINLSNCTSLEELPDSIATLKLRNFIITGCTSLETLPNEFWWIQSKESRFNFDDCPVIEALPEARDGMPVALTSNMRWITHDVTEASLERKSAMLGIFQDKSWVKVDTTFTMYEALSEKRCAENAEGLQRLVWLNPTSRHFTDANIEQLPAILQNEGVRIFLSWLVRIITFGLSAIFANPLTYSKARFELRI